MELKEFILIIVSIARAIKAIQGKNENKVTVRRK